MSTHLMEAPAKPETITITDPVAGTFEVYKKKLAVPVAPCLGDCGRYIRAKRIEWTLEGFEVVPHAGHSRCNRCNNALFPRRKHDLAVKRERSAVLKEYKQDPDAPPRPSTIAGLDKFMARRNERLARSHRRIAS